MSTIVHPRTGLLPAPVRRSRTTWWPVAAAAAVSVGLRIPLLHAPMSSDEGGFLYLAQHWSRSGGSLYGPSWVDRPPLLVALFRLGDTAGGVVGLRLLGCVAVAVSVLALGSAAGRIAGRRAAGWAAATAAALLAAPTLGTTSVNGELLATPFVAGGLWLTVFATTAASRRGTLAAAFGAGVCAAAALMVKQNFADVVVFAAVLVWTSRRARSRTFRVVPAVTGVVAGGLAGAGSVLATAWWVKGTDPASVLWAMYPFRLRAAGVITGLPLTGRAHHVMGLLQHWAFSGAPLLLAALAVVVVRRSALRTPASLAVLALAAFDLVSIAAGGSYWSHYLVQLVPATALAAGLLAARHGAGRRLVAIVLALATLSWSTAFGHRAAAPGEQVGASLASVAQPGDTVVSLLGNPDIVRASGLTSPYPYLWSLPSRTLDPDMAELATLLDGPDAPTWVVVRGPNTMAELVAHPTATAITGRYHEVAVLCGRPVLLRADLVRPVPPTLGCRRPVVSWH